MTSFAPYPREVSQVPGRDPLFTEAISKNMRVPEHLSVGRGEEDRGRTPEEPPPAYSMHIPDRLTYTEAPDMSPRPLFTPSRPAVHAPPGPEPCWESRSAGGGGDVFYREPLQSPIRRSYSDQSFGKTPPGTPTRHKPAPALHSRPSNSAMESWSLEEEGGGGGGAAVEFIVLRRQVMKMSRRLAGLERQNAERRNTEVVLFSLLLSACLLNTWLWLRR